MTNFLDEIPGNDKVKIILSSILESGNIPHAFLFTGAEGVGKEKAAISFIKALNQKYLTPEKSKKIIPIIDKLSEPYIKYIFPLPRKSNETENDDPYQKLTEGEVEQISLELMKKSDNLFYKIQVPKANVIKINSIRDIKKFLAYNYDDVKYRLILISQAHLMNDPSQNALLKNLEEPPEGVIFILSTSAPEKLRETIISRCWKINFQPLNNDDLLENLVNKFEVDSEIAKEVAPFSGGSIHTAISLIENDFEELLERTIKILRYSFGKKYHSALLEFEDILSESNTVKLNLIITMIIIWLNDFQKFKLDNKNQFFFSKYIETLQKFNSRYSELDISNAANQLDKISTYFKNNINPNIAVTNIIFQLSSLITAG